MLHNVDDAFDLELGGLLRHFGDYSVGVDVKLNVVIGPCLVKKVVKRKEVLAIFGAVCDGEIERKKVVARFLKVAVTFHILADYKLGKLFLGGLEVAEKFVKFGDHLLWLHD